MENASLENNCAYPNNSSCLQYLSNYTHTESIQRPSCAYAPTPTAEINTHSCSYMPDTQLMSESSQGDNEPDESRLKREKKNDAVRKSRQKSKRNTADTEIQVQRLTEHNIELSQYIHNLQCELARLKEIYLQQSHLNQLSLSKNLIE